MKTIELRKYTSIAFHWVKGHIGLEGHERATYLAKTVVSNNTTMADNALPINPGKQNLENY
jgi:ribonuclease HI